MIANIAVAILALAAYFYHRIRCKLRFFENRNVEYDKNVSFFGSLKDVLFRRVNMYDMVEVMYNQFDSSVVGAFELWSPFFIIRNPEIINKIMIGDFPNFMNHRDIFHGDSSGLLATNLHSMNDQKWRDMRSTLTPAFTGSKLRAMFDLVRDTADESLTSLKKEIGTFKELNMKDFFTRYACDVIATTAFGFKINSMEEKRNAFFLMGKGVAEFGKLALLKFIALIHFPKLSSFLKINLISEKHTNYFKTLVLDTMKLRYDKKIFRTDLINMLMEARGMDVLGHGLCQDVIKWTDNELVAQSLLFFFSGFESVSSVLCFISQELMENQDVQSKLKQEIHGVLKELNGGQLTYEVLNGMKYMDCVISETLRKWPVNPLTDRVCTRSIEIQDPETGETIEIRKGDKIMIPIVGLHRDPRYFPDPMKFDPERFNEQNKGNIKPSTYLPFGIGQRMCIANRFALMEIKIMLFYMFSDLKVGVSDKSMIPLEMDPALTQPHPKNGYWVRLLSDKE